MEIIATILVIIVALEHLGIMVLEIFGSPEKQAQSFDLDTKFTRQTGVKVLLANQGIYNGMLGSCLLASIWVFPGSIQLAVQLMLLTFIVIVALFGGFTATKKIWLLQLLPALLAAIVICIIL